MCVCVIFLNRNSMNSNKQTDLYLFILNFLCWIYIFYSSLLGCVHWVSHGFKVKGILLIVLVVVSLF